ncbi:MAG: MipA/OmpV family protein [Oligoflexia bacterium]|nr:MipA/OmpV family protein [Oligoflexia bacterium]
MNNKTPFKTILSIIIALITLTAIINFTVVITAVAFADSGSDSDGLKISAGGGYAVSTNIRKNSDLDGKGEDYISSWVPLVTFSWWRFAFRGLQSQLKLTNEPIFAFAVKISRIGQEYRSAYLSKRRSSFAIGGDLRLILINISYLRDIDGVSGGHQYQFASGLPLSIIGNFLFLHIGFGLELYDKKYVDYYFGVRDTEIMSDRPQYIGEKTWNRFLSLTITFKPIELFSISLSARYKNYGKSIKNSPTVRTNDELSYMAMMIFNII